MGTNDPGNISSKLREGYEPCKAEDYPELMMHATTEGRFKGGIEVGGLLLCRIPEEFLVQRAEYYANQNKAQMEATLPTSSLVTLSSWLALALSKKTLVPLPPLPLACLLVANSPTHRPNRFSSNSTGLPVPSLLTLWHSFWMIRTFCSKSLLCLRAQPSLSTAKP